MLREDVIEHLDKAYKMGWVILTVRANNSIGLMSHVSEDAPENIREVIHQAFKLLSRQPPGYDSKEEQQGKINYPPDFWDVDNDKKGERQDEQ